MPAASVCRQCSTEAGGSRLLSQHDGGIADTRLPSRHLGS
jgi:hypothetical protein